MWADGPAPPSSGADRPHRGLGCDPGAKAHQTPTDPPPHGVPRRVLAHQEVRAARPLLALVHEGVHGTQVSVQQHVHHLLSFRYSSSSDDSSSSISSSKLLPVNVMNTDSRVGSLP